MHLNHADADTDADADAECINIIEILYSCSILIVITLSFRDSHPIAWNRRL